MFFKEQIKKRIKNEKGLTLIELLAVIVILAIVAAIAIPAIGNIINNQRDKAVLSDISGMVASAKIAFADGSCGADNICQFGTATNEIDFASEKFTEGTVSFAVGSKPSEIKITTNYAATGFKGKNAAAYTTLLGTTGGFTEKDLNDKMGN